MSNSKRTKLDQCNLAQLHERTRANTNTHMCHIYTQPNRTPVRGMPQDACNGRRVMRLCYGALRARARVCKQSMVRHTWWRLGPPAQCLCLFDRFIFRIYYVCLAFCHILCAHSNTYTHTHVSARLSPCKSFIIYTVY